MKRINKATSYKLVKYEDLNHHKTLFAGKASSWVLETGYISVTAVSGYKNFVCLKINELKFYKTSKNGRCFSI